MMQSCLVLFGGAIGALLRFWLGQQMQKRWGGAFPLPTFLINMLGSFALGLLFAASDGGSLWWLFGTGLLGAFTTFSTFSVEAMTLFQRGKRSVALAYLIGSATLGLLFAWLGLTLDGLLD